jgi:hypothetical protein
MCGSGVGRGTPCLGLVFRLLIGPPPGVSTRIILWELFSFLLMKIREIRNYTIVTAHYPLGLMGQVSV